MEGAAAVTGIPQVEEGGGSRPVLGWSADSQRDGSLTSCRERSSVLPSVIVDGNHAELVLG